MELDTLQMALEVARQGSFAAVARDRNLDPSSISRAIALLEAQLGFRLFQRSTRRLTVTEAGDLYLERLRLLVEELHKARDDALAINTGPRGTLRLTASVAFGQLWLLPHIAQFRQQYPELRLELLLTDIPLDLVRDRIDLAIRLGPRMKGDFERIQLFETRYRVCASPAYLAKCPPIRVPEDLSEHDCLRFTLPGFRSQWTIRDRQGAVKPIAIDGAIACSNALALRQLTLAGSGPTLLADWAIFSDLETGQLQEILPQYEVTATTFSTAAWLLYPSRTFLPHKVRVMLDFLQQQAARAHQ